MKTLSLSLIGFLLISCTSSTIPNPMSNMFKDNVKRQYFTGGKIRSEFIPSNKNATSGLLKIYGVNGKVTSTSVIVNGAKDGDMKYYTPNGIVIKKIPYVNGSKEGVEEIYYPNGQTMVQISYVHNVRHGTAIKYNQDGSINEKVIYQNGRRMG